MVVDTAYTAVIKRIHTESRGNYGAPRIHAELADDYNIRCGRKRVARLMRQAGLVGCTTDARCGPLVVTPTSRRHPMR